MAEPYLCLLIFTKYDLLLKKIYLKLMDNFTDIDIYTLCLSIIETFETAKYYE
jgi:hypothetical protein